MLFSSLFFFFFFNDTATTEIYTLSLHDALPILPGCVTMRGDNHSRHLLGEVLCKKYFPIWITRSEEHTSELQSQSNLVCRLLLEKKKKKRKKCRTSKEIVKRKKIIINLRDE